MVRSLWLLALAALASSLRIERGTWQETWGAEEEHPKKKYHMEVLVEGQSYPVVATKHPGFHRFDVRVPYAKGNSDIENVPADMLRPLTPMQFSEALERAQNGCRTAEEVARRNRAPLWHSPGAKPRNCEGLPEKLRALLKHRSKSADLRRKKILAQARRLNATHKATGNATNATMPEETDDTLEELQ
mmetsp:Transcript_75135/g.174234  ORF Transcript_75135/g.174234 Transcript_75135/m.174234 type:complete len:188 (+) Transcript_75135:55-618(+)|eukprot:CAMPEP_0171107724 /NCGR_PEP_ID=MMETSP0766_2-20121228/67440_1 /TAXON_ID=439317 /ORGANISM="Gambierdiscus australes, Strain CAWD 149" /LENGTH=187 /DNA_ID=CAMNT_0011569105 /DNA_START=54 /DNA_END=617 /DNA_ORIENTATION=+